MTDQPKTRPISKDRKITSLFPTRFLKPAQLIAWQVTSLIVTIARIVEEEVSPKPHITEWKPVLYFMGKNGSEHPQGYLLSAKVDAESLTSATNAETIEELPGKQIRIMLSEYRGKAVLRIDPQPIPPPPIEGEPEPEEESDPEAFTDSAAGEEMQP
jgi:hypothetical protein